MPPSARARSLPWLSSPASPDSPANETSTATLRLTSCVTPCPPCLPVRSSYRSVRSHVKLIEEVALHLADTIGTQACPYEALDSTAMPVRDAKRRGAGWLAGHAADIGWSNRLGWYEGFRLLVAVGPKGVITSSLASPLLPSPTSHWPRPSLPRDTIRFPGWGAPDRPPRELTYPTRGSRAPRTTGDGSTSTERGSFIRQSATAVPLGPKGSDDGWLVSVSSWRRSTTNS